MRRSRSGAPGPLVPDEGPILAAIHAELRHPGAARAWLHTVLRNVCLMRIRQRREIPSAEVELPGVLPGPEEALDNHVMREWVWQALDSLSAEERLAVMLRYFTRCTSYAAVPATIADVLASSGITVLEIDFCNPAEWPGHCPPQANFIHRLSDGRTRQLQIHYPAENWQR